MSRLEAYSYLIKYQVLHIGDANVIIGYAAALSRFPLALGPDLLWVIVFTTFLTLIPVTCRRKVADS